MATNLERATPVIPGTENMEFEHQTSLHRVSLMFLYLITLI